MDDMTGWILKDRQWGGPSPRLRESDTFYLVVCPVPSRPPWKWWTLVDMRTGARVTMKDEDLANSFRFRRVA